MKLATVVFFLSAVTFNCAENLTLSDLSAYNYHEKHGFLRAQDIFEYEEAVKAQKIVGGSLSSVETHPFQAGLVIDILGRVGNSVCGGSLLTRNRALTAAHCWFDGVNQAWRLTVVLGSTMLFSGGLRVPTTTVVLHHDWLPNWIANDVAIIVLPYEITYTAQIQPIHLPSGRTAGDDFVDNWAVASGFGRTLDSQVGVGVTTSISSVTLQVIPNDNCFNIFGNYVRYSTICTNGTGGVGVCGGDSGGPLYITRNGLPTVIGVSSFVAAAGCQLGFPSAFARVTSFLGWIYTHL